jgi:hypothetical protein
MLNVIMLSVTNKPFFAECRSAECRCVECRGAHQITLLIIKNRQSRGRSHILFWRKFSHYVNVTISLLCFEKM